MLSEGTQSSIHNAFNELIEKKIVEYSSMHGEDKGDVIQIGDLIELNFETKDDGKPKTEKEIINKF